MPLLFCHIKQFKKCQINNNEKQNDAIANENEENMETGDVCETLKTYGDIRKDYEKYCSMGKMKETCQELP